MKKFISLLIVIVMLTSLSTIAFATETVQVEEETMEPVSVVVFDDGTIVEEYGDGISFVYYEAEETAMASSLQPARELLQITEYKNIGFKFMVPLMLQVLL